MYLNTYFKWKEEFTLGIESIDIQHKKLFEIGNRVGELIKYHDKYDNYDSILQILDELTEYTDFHFKYEENMLKEKRYNKYHLHKKEHLIFINRIREMVNSDKLDNEQRKILREIMGFLSDWLVEHILVQDKEYANFLSNKISS